MNYNFFNKQSSTKHEINNDSTEQLAITELINPDPPDTPRGSSVTLPLQNEQSIYKIY